MKSYISLSFLSAILLLSACGKENIATITPTEAIVNITDTGITGVNIGDTVKKMIDTYGNVPDSWGSIGGTYNHFLWYVEKGIIARCEANKSEILDVNLKITSFEFSEPFKGKTAKGIAIGSTKESVIATYGQPTSTSAYNGDQYGTMFFKYNDAGTAVEEIVVK
jgi:hypothetical protein